MARGSNMNEFHDSKGFIPEQWHAALHLEFTR